MSYKNHKSEIFHIGNHDKSAWLDKDIDIV